MVSIIITTYKETKTLKRSLDLILSENIPEDYEVLVVAPDEETELLVRTYSVVNLQVRFLKDWGKGKPAALNLAFKEARGEIFVLTDGDVYMEKGSLAKLLLPLKDPKVGAVSGRPVSLNQRSDMFGYWSHLLTEAGAHQQREKCASRGQFLDCSGYLYAIRNIVREIPEDALSDDMLVSHLVWQKGLKIAYAPEARVYVKYPTHFKDWILQKRRSMGGYTQIKKYGLAQEEEMRSFGEEVKEGWHRALAYPKNFREFCWTIALFFARLYVWILIFVDLKIRKKGFREIWQRVESAR